MSELTLFLNRARFDTALQNRIRSAMENSGVLETAPRFIAVAKEYGYKITEADLFNFFRKDEPENICSLSDDILENVTGGDGIKDTSDKSWWEYVVETVDAVAKGLGHCFTGECLVTTPDGVKAIKDIKTGDEVISLDKNGSKRNAKVTDVIVPREMPVIEVTFTDGNKWNTTKTQWFYCGDDTYACAADDQGRKALTLDGQSAGVIEVVETERKELVYDFVVDGLNVMFVNGIAAEGFSLS